MSVFVDGEWVEYSRAVSLRPGVADMPALWLFKCEGWRQHPHEAVEWRDEKRASRCFVCDAPGRNRIGAWTPAPVCECVGCDAALLLGT